jgi:hypothetical protein
MTSTITNYSNLIDTTFPVPGVDNDTQGFRANSINIQQAFDTAADEITNLQTEYGGLLSQLNNATIVGENYAAVVASTVTTLVVNSLSNYNPDIVSPIVSVWYNTTITNAITNITSATLVTVSNPPAASTGTVGDMKGMFCVTTSAVYFCYNNYVGDNADIWAKVNTVGKSWP